jgi:hypothetical protein
MKLNINLSIKNVNQKVLLKIFAKIMKCLSKIKEGIRHARNVQTDVYLARWMIIRLSAKIVKKIIRKIKKLNNVNRMMIR